MPVSNDDLVFSDDLYNTSCETRHTFGQLVIGVAGPQIRDFRETPGRVVQCGQQ